MPEIPTPKERVEKYDPAEFMAAADGTPIAGWRSITVERFGPINELSEPSADGKVHRIRKHDPRMRARIVLAQDSPSLFFMRALAGRDHGFTFGVKDKSGTPDGASMWDCAIENEAPVTRSATSSDYEFTIVGAGVFDDEQNL